jgi:flagellar M-ring protein FliF
VREAMGFRQDRGDTVNVVNAPFNAPEVAAAATPESPIWRDWLTPANLIEWAKYALVGVVVLYLWFGFLRPTLRDLMQVGRTEPSMSGFGEGGGTAPATAPMGSAPTQAGFENDLQAARDLARQDPRIVANVVKDWVGRE